tara:strand:- start:125 stop:568 length:444 start_codon:yes stop_codon:yes gene_type:complete
MKKINTTKPVMLYVAELIYENILSIKKENPNISNIDAVERFIGTDPYNKISSGSFHDTLFRELQKNKYINKESGEKISKETIQLLEIQKKAITEQLIDNSSIYYAKNSYPLENFQKAFDLLWRMCESYELWCAEVGKKDSIILKISN